jgi:homoserine dehydrogenase
MGVVGGGVARVLIERAEEYARQAGRPLALRRVLVRDLARARSAPVASGILTTTADDILLDPEIQIVVEVLGGEQPALEYIRRSLTSGKHVVTANKEVLAKHGPSLLALAREHNVGLLFEASAGGGIPLIAPLKRDLLANHITSLRAIVNGTTNYILTRMSNDGLDFGDALAQAQALGYAEADPANDVEGVDAAYKLSILAGLAFRTTVQPDDVYREGITRLTANDFRYARELGYAIKLLAIARRFDDGSVLARVHPALLREDQPLAKVDGVFNAVEIEGDLVGRVLFQGQGAGALPTTSAVMGDLLDLARAISTRRDSQSTEAELGQSIARPVSELRARYYLRLRVPDRAGVLSKVCGIVGDRHGISISDIIQKETSQTDQSAEIVIMTHEASEASMRSALTDLEQLTVVNAVGNFIRVEAPEDLAAGGR